MRGKLVVIKPSDNGEAFRKPDIREEEIYGPIDIVEVLDKVKAGLDGGTLEQVPNFTTYDGQRCVAFCDEDGKGKGLKYNYHGTALLWLAHTIAMSGDALFVQRGDYIAGPLVIIAGDDELINSL